jgi:ADP-heptose:LPS heptosyltransferase
MGLGDWIMATADAKKVNEAYGVRVQFGDGRNAYWNEVFERNPRIAKELEPNERFAWLANYPRNRPYINVITKDRLIFNPDFKASPGELFPSNPRAKGDYILIEPNVKRKFKLGENKDWGFGNWQKLVKQLDAEWYQMGEGDKLDKSKHILTKSIDEAFNVLAGAKLLVTTDGALHHAAAAMGIPAIVLWGGLASPENLGYESHINLWHGDEPCGTHSKTCKHCKQAMAKISIDEVLTAIQGAI